MDQVTAVGREPLSSCCLFWLLLPVLHLSTLHSRTPPSLLLVANRWGEWECALVYVGTYTIHTIPPHSLFLQKKTILSFPLKACTSSNAGEMWTAEGGEQTDSVWVCQNNKWIPYEWVTTNVTMEIQKYKVSYWRKQTLHSTLHLSLCTKCKWLNTHTTHMKTGHIMFNWGLHAQHGTK